MGQQRLRSAWLSDQSHHSLHYLLEKWFGSLAIQADPSHRCMHRSFLLFLFNMLRIKCR